MKTGAVTAPRRPHARISVARSAEGHSNLVQICDCFGKCWDQGGSQPYCELTGTPVRENYDSPNLARVLNLAPTPEGKEQNNKTTTDKSTMDTETILAEEVNSRDLPMKQNLCWKFVSLHVDPGREAGWKSMSKKI
jgi:hypothetical protein